MKSIKDIIDILEHRGTEPNQVIVESTINMAIDVLKRLDRNSQPGVDFQGWPIEEVKFKDLKDYVNKLDGIDENATVRVLMDDGMGYGALNGKCTGVHMSKNLEGNTDELQIWF